MSNAFDDDSTVPFNQKQHGAHVDSLGTAPTASISDDVASTKSWQQRPATPAPAIQLPCRFGDYELLEILGQGGMGIVYKARQLTANRLVALKLIRPEYLSRFMPAARQTALARFDNEAKAAARLEHDHVVTVYDVGQVDGQSYYAMRLVEAPA